MFYMRWKYSGPPNFERLGVRTKIFEENSVLKLEQKLASWTNNHVVVTPFREVAPQYRSYEQEYQPV
jgi:hypothetical protein